MASSVLDPPNATAHEHDYMVTVPSTIPSFHFRTGHHPLLPTEIAPKNPSNQFGFPRPGPQSPTSVQATAKHYFVENNTWEAILDHGEFDDIVVGSGFCALAYIDAAYKRDPWRKILVLERGGFWLSEHFQNMPLPFKLVLGGPSETFPWQLSSKTAQSPFKFMHGSCPFFGGRSTFWSAWCPRPEQDLMRNFPESMITTAKPEEFWQGCQDLLLVTKADEINDPCFGKRLQNDIQTRLDKGVKAGKISTANTTNHAPLAVGRKTSIANAVAFDKFSTPGPLLKIYEQQRHKAKVNKGHPLAIATDTVVERFELDPNDPKHRPNVLYTSRGALSFPNTKTNIILAAGVFPSTTILMNSIGDNLAGRAGSRVGGHFISHITARFPIAEPSGSDGFLPHLEIGASYLAGKDPSNRLQYHIQITAIHSPSPETDAEDAARLCPDYAAAATAEQLAGSERHIVLVCATLGELNEENPHSWVVHNPASQDVTTNVRLQVLPDEKTDSLQRVMEKATYDAIKVMAGDQADSIEYWHDVIVERRDKDSQRDAVTIKSHPGWKRNKPPADMVRVPGLVHETSTLYMSDNLEKDKNASVDSQYRPRGCDNVFVTGGAIFPTSGSWNPTLTMCGFAQDLARKIVKERHEPPHGCGGHLEGACT
ncbi:hypothetical protein QCA50_004922 [Cerrena zonata]|uniref:Glucose-methanol-choline oxidoreductase C-terminal domain-containing protein n=1 Tax=Cerrena zonata TaxID=2478898 RepID=A0AAW0GDD1_9APHY